MIEWREVKGVCLIRKTSEIPLAPVKLNGSTGWLRPMREQPDV